MKGCWETNCEEMKRLRSIVAARLEPKSRREMEDAAMIAYTASLVSTERSHVPCVDRGHLDKIHCATERIAQVLNPYRRCCSAVQVHPVHLGLNLLRRVQLLQPTGIHRCSTSKRDLLVVHLLRPAGFHRCNATVVIAPRRRPPRHRQSLHWSGACQ